MSETNMFAQDHCGEYYVEVLKRLHSVLNPTTYFEIGTLFGTTLTLSNCASIAVDPLFQLNVDALGTKPSCQFFQMGSDRFFKEHNLTTLFGSAVDIAFLDGLHYFEFLLRDFINVERHCRNNSIVILHDCIPTDGHTAAREGDSPELGLSRRVGEWAGDVWKTVAILKRLRPDLKIHCFDAPPTGLVMITNLDPKSTILAENYFQITSEYMHMNFKSFGLSNFLNSLDIQPTSALATHSKITNFFWL